MKIAIMGASGFVGKHLIRHLLQHTDYVICGLCPDPEQLKEFSSFGNRFVAMKSDVFDGDQLHVQLSGVSMAYFLVHMMGRSDGDFYDLEARAAETFGQAARDSGVKRVVYMSGLGSDREKLSKHLASRHNTGAILRTYIPQVIEFRASMIIGPGSISFEIVRSLVKKLPIMTLPKWSNTRTQPIGLSDAIMYLIDAITVQVTGHEIIEIGGPEQISYESFLKRYATFLGKRCFIIRVPILPEWLAGWWLDVFAPPGAGRVGRHMVDSFRNHMVVTNHRARELFPQILPKPFEQAFY